MNRINLSNFGKLIFVLSILVLGSILPAVAFAQTVNLSPNSLTIGQNQQFTVDVAVDNMTDLFGLGFDLLFDPSLVQFISATDGGFLSQGASAPILTAVNPPGDLIFSQARMGAYSGAVSGSGLIAHLNFQTLSKDGTSNLSFFQGAICKLVSGSCSYPTASWNNATVVINTPDTTSPSAPTSLSAVAVSTSQINLTWDPSTDNKGVVGYQIFRNTANLNQNIAGTAYQDTGLNPATSYNYSVIAYDAAGNHSMSSNIAVATTLAPVDNPPSAPTGLTAQAVSTSQINLSWNASTDDHGISGYRVYRNNSLVTTVTGTTYQNTGLLAGTVYTFRVVAVDTVNQQSLDSNVVSATTLTPPDTTAPVVTITSPTSNAAYITSDSVLTLAGTATDNIAVINYGISTSGGWSDAVIIAPSASTDWSFNFINLMFGINVITISASDAAGNVGTDIITVTYNAPDTTTPTVPTGLGLVSATTNQINIAWNSSTDDVAVTGYKVYRNNVYMMTVTTPAYYNAGLPTGTTYNYQISAVDAAGNESAWTAALSAATLTIAQTDKTAPTIPAYLRASLGAATTVNLNWYASNDYAFGGVAPSGVAGYRIYRNNNWVANISSTNYGDSGLAKSTSYIYQVVSYDKAGNDSTKSNSVQIATSGTDITRPNVPGGLRKKGSTSYLIEIAWNAATDPSGYLAPASGVVGYKIYRNGAYLATVSTLSYDDKNLIPQTSYRYQVSSLDGAGNESALSGILTATTDLPPDTIAPTTPTNLRYSYNLYYYPKDVRLYWYGSRDNRPGQVRYNIYRNGQLIALTTWTSYYQKLSDYGVYQYQIKAVDIAGNESAGSNMVSINYVPDTTAPSTPTNLRVSYNLFYYPKDVRLYWYGSRDERPGRVAYNIYRNGEFVASTTWTSYYQKLSDYGVYQYQIKAVDIAGNESAGSNIVSINYAPDETAPKTPSNFRVYQDYRDKSLVRGYWYGVRDERPGQVKYNIYRNGEKITTTIWASFYEKLTVRGNYQYQVAAVDVAGNESARTTSVTIVW